jgi:hypothetical protein
MEKQYIIILDGNVTHPLLNEHQSKASSCISSNDSGKTRLLDNSEQLLNAPDSIILSVDGKTMFSDLQPRNASLPITVTPSGI